MRGNHTDDAPPSRGVPREQQNVPQCAFNVILVSEEQFVFHLHYLTLKLRGASKSFTLLLEK